MVWLKLLMGLLGLLLVGLGAWAALLFWVSTAISDDTGLWWGVAGSGIGAAIGVGLLTWAIMS